MGMKTRTAGEVELAQDPNTFPNSGLSLAVRWLADRVNWLAVVDGLLFWLILFVMGLTNDGGLSSPIFWEVLSTIREFAQKMEPHEKLCSLSWGPTGSDPMAIITLNLTSDNCYRGAYSPTNPTAPRTPRIVW